MMLSKYSMGIGDRFARQGVAQLTALVQAKALGVDMIPVWNKSNREHLIVHTHPDSVRVEADAAVKALGWKGPYHVDADHIGLKTVDAFISASDFFTLDVADFTGQAAPEADIQDFVARHHRYATTLKIPGIDRTLAISERDIAGIARKYLLAVQEAGAIYRHIEAAKGRDRFITEVSIDETDTPQTPIELLFILAAVADQKIPAQTIAPKFTGRFNKGVDYVGDRRPVRKGVQRGPGGDRVRDPRNSVCPPISSSACTPAATSSRSTARLPAHCGSTTPGCTSRRPARHGWKKSPGWRWQVGTR